MPVVGPKYRSKVERVSGSLFLYLIHCLGDNRRSLKTGLLVYDSSIER